MDKAEPQARTDRGYVTKRCFVPDSSLRTKATEAEWHALDRICAKAKLARLYGRVRVKEGETTGLHILSGR